MKVQLKHYKYYEKIMKRELEKSIVKTSEYQNFSELYPYIAESIRLERKIKKLKNLLKSEKNNNRKFKIKREMAITKSKVKKNNLHKSLHGESKKEKIFRKKLLHNKSKLRYSMLGKFQTILGQPVKKIYRKIIRLMHRNLPPSLFNLRELTVEEKGLALREWLQEKRSKLR